MRCFLLYTQNWMSGLHRIVLQMIYLHAKVKKGCLKTDQPGLLFWQGRRIIQIYIRFTPALGPTHSYNLGEQEGRSVNLILTCILFRSPDCVKLYLVIPPYALIG